MVLQRSPDHKDNDTTIYTMKKICLTVPEDARENLYFSFYNKNLCIN